MRASEDAIPDDLWIERDRRRSEWIEAREDPYNYFDEDAILRMLVKQLRAEIAELHDTALRWWPQRGVGHRKLAHAYWLIYDATNTVTNLQKAGSHLRIAIRAEPGNWLQHANLGTVEDALGHPQKALASYSEAARLTENAGIRDELQQECRRLSERDAADQEELGFSSASSDEPSGIVSEDHEETRTITRRKVEGALGAGYRIERVRDPRLRADALAAHGPVCMLCGLDPRKYYPEDYALQAVEVHHVIPLARSTPGETDLENVWIVCANCHNVIHAWIEDGGKPGRVGNARLFRPLGEGEIDRGLA